MLHLVLLFVIFSGTNANTIDSLSVLTNEVDSEILRYYSDLPNKLTDISLQAVRDYLLQHRQTQIGIPPLDVNFTEPILGMDLINGEFKANNGIFINPATVVRKGNSSITHNGYFHYNLSTIIGFTDMEVYFPQYEATVIGISESGDVRVLIGTNEILIQVSVAIIPKCTVTLSNLKITKFADITTDITGLGILNGLANYITSWVLSSYETQLTDLIENIVANKLADVLAKTGGFCHYKPTIAKNRVPRRNISCQKANGSRLYKCQVK